MKSQNSKELDIILEAMEDVWLSAADLSEKTGLSSAQISLLLHHRGKNYVDRRKDGDRYFYRRTVL